jgi:hypothetical protein
MWISLSTRTIGHYAGGAPPILYVPTFPWKYFIFTKRKRNKEIKRELFLSVLGGSHFFVRTVSFGFSGQVLRTVLVLFF